MNINPKILALAIAVVAVSAQFTVSQAQAAEKITVNYRLADWKTIEISDANEAKSLFTTFKQLGCEAKQEKHGDHTDISYRCVKWRAIAFKNHKTAHAWEKWLKASGFEAKHKH